MTKKRLYLQIAAKHTPDFVRAISVAGCGFRSRAHVHEENDVLTIRKPSFDHSFPFSQATIRGRVTGRNQTSHKWSK